MTTIRRFYNQDVIISRLRTLSGNKKAFQSTATVEAHVQSLDAEARTARGILTARAWRAWMDPDSDVKDGDKLTDEDGNVYYVREVTARQYGTNQHKEVVLEEQNA